MCVNLSCECPQSVHLSISWIHLQLPRGNEVLEGVSVNSFNVAQNQTSASLMGHETETKEGSLRKKKLLIPSVDGMALVRKSFARGDINHRMKATESDKR